MLATPLHAVRILGNKPRQHNRSGPPIRARGAAKAARSDVGTALRCAWHPDPKCPMMPPMKHRRPNLPTLITIVRLVLSPFVVLLFYLAINRTGYGAPIDETIRLLQPGWLLAAFLILLLQEASDIVDGELARRNKLVTDLGKLLDPLADTMSHIGALLCLMWVGLVPLWLLIVIYYREAAVATMRTLAAKHGMVMAARKSGKVKSLSQAVIASGLVGMLLAAHYWPSLPVKPVATALSWIVGAVTLFSLFDYFQAVRTLTRESGRDPMEADAS